MIVFSLISIVIVISTYFICRNRIYHGRIWLDWFGIFFVWLLISSFYNDLGNWNFELARKTHFTYGTLFLSHLLVIFFITSAVSYKYGMAFVLSDVSRQEKVDFRIIFYVLTVLIGILNLLAIVHHVYSYGIVLIVDRASHFDRLPGWIQSLIQYKYIVGAVLGACAINVHKKLFILVISIIVIFGLLSGNKFSYFSDMFFPLCAVYISSKGSFPFRKSYILIGVPLALLLIAVYAIYKYSLSSSEISFAFELLKYRLLGGQGALWWSIFERWNGVGFQETGHLVNTLAMDGKGILSTELGMKYMMSQVLLPDVLQGFKNSGYSLTMGFPAILIVRYGLIGATVGVAIVSAIMGFLIGYITTSIRHHYWTRVVLGFYLFISIAVVVRTGNLFLAFSIGLIGKIAILVIYEFVDSLKKTKRVGNAVESL